MLSKTALSKPVQWLLRNRGLEVTENPHICVRWDEEVGDINPRQDVGIV